MKNFKVLEGCLEQMEISFVCIEFPLIPPESEWFHITERVLTTYM